MQECLYDKESFFGPGIPGHNLKEYPSTKQVKIDAHLKTQSTSSIVHFDYPTQ